MVISDAETVSIKWYTIHNKCIMIYGYNKVGSLETWYYWVLLNAEKRIPYKRA